ncbi:hypothetical protein DAY19_11710 [Halobacteriovorax vibrionivorans]|uniref:YokE-like PH domain-containing protein n=1 Tax=Halobacteriovorax vibrionivorans TaxID=2152716 RepID=A0ABY0IDP7_9BACT|nr:hypothetical protein [Halobacteriovorax vibrionivorans]RZF20644.1 hypothetical protein DAY19_11710 [Halobacteriovorax vibrionivorans]TGD48946.1 hypothetical protein EP118_02020 [Halobacteriovorax sp. Y22]
MLLLFSGNLDSFKDLFQDHGLEKLFSWGYRFILGMFVFLYFENRIRKGTIVVDNINSQVEVTSAYQLGVVELSEIYDLEKIYTQLDPIWGYYVFSQSGKKTLKLKINKVFLNGKVCAVADLISCLRKHS